MNNGLLLRPQLIPESNGKIVLFSKNEKSNNANLIRVHSTVFINEPTYAMGQYIYEGTKLWFLVDSAKQIYDIYKIEESYDSLDDLIKALDDILSQ